MQNFEQILNNTKRKNLMVIFPHPDDETFASGGLLLEAKKYGWQTIVVILTKGGAGKIHIDSQSKTLEEIRTNELAEAVNILKVDHLVLGDFPDGGLRKKNAKWVLWLSSQLDKFKPSLVVTYDNAGFTGHPDHIILSLEIKKLLEKRENVDLYWATSLEDKFIKFVNIRLLKNLAKTTHELNLDPTLLFSKWLAILKHKSQGYGKKYGLQTLAYLFKNHFEWYHKVDLDVDYDYKFVKFDI